ncbi:MAG TPA: hypothetical protein DEQ80_08970 [Anaerolinea thermolimosa]|uniref:Uncharacterized protein n=1 Tax=Anaerolinea thermolimosa TaxID=229919 RepID=A0A3D1JIB6_9CHLR|nr:hypothetical protein [Anaerolinea thermolimosa]GAP05872.1 hypothetical protein ATHL_00713 [Anaerolinea thermolimosa]HCE17977.1 hypothetical protein [Anaerolinea thermolimosa]
MKDWKSTESTQKHHRQVLTQILLPLWLSILVGVGLAVLAVIGTVHQSSEVNRWGNISAIFVILPNLITSLFTLVILFLIVRGVSIFHQKLAGWLIRLQGIFHQLRLLARSLADRVVAPVFFVHQMNARVQYLRKKFILRG